MLDVTKPVQTRDGRKARIICTDRKGENYPIGALVEDEGGLESAFLYTQEGNLIVNKEGPLDLVNIPEEYTLWGIAIDQGCAPHAMSREKEFLESIRSTGSTLKQYLVKEILP